MKGSEDFAARTELLPVQTLTLTNQQFLSNCDSSGKATVIAGQLRIAQERVRSRQHPPRKRLPEKVLIFRNIA
jgi:hypothetical protein